MKNVLLPLAAVALASCSPRVDSSLVERLQDTAQVAAVEMPVKKHPAPSNTTIAAVVDSILEAHPDWRQNEIKRERLRAALDSALPRALAINPAALSEIPLQLVATTRDGDKYALRFNIYDLGHDYSDDYTLDFLVITHASEAVLERMVERAIYLVRYDPADVAAGVLELPSGERGTVSARVSGEYARRVDLGGATIRRASYQRTYRD